LATWARWVTQSNSTSVSPFWKCSPARWLILSTRAAVSLDSVVKALRQIEQRCRS